MYWMHKTDHDAGVVRFKVTGGYNYRAALRAQGFDFDRLKQNWRIEVPIHDEETILRIEEFLKAADKIDMAGAKWKKLEHEGESE